MCVMWKCIKSVCVWCGNVLKAYADNDAFVSHMIKYN